MAGTPIPTRAEGAHGADAALLRDRVTAAIGDVYLIGEEVGRGGMAVVYAAEDVRLQRPVALKVLPPELAFRPDVRERFVREAQTAARLNHPHIVPIYAVHEVGGMVCFAMALVRGESLAARVLREGKPSFEFIARMLEQVADALAYAHACGVVHRDIKPDNVLIDQDSGRAMVTDFGIARAAEGGSRLTQTGIAVGTPAFMSPEQAMGDREVDGRSDVYSVGVVGYLMVAGKLPFEASSTPAMLMKHVSDSPPPLRALRPDAPRVLVDILERCLAKRPQDRFESALQLRDALRRAQRDGSLAIPGTVDPQAPARAAAPAGPPSLARDDKYGHRSEDWAPRRVAEPAPAPRQLPAPGVLPPMPQLPPVPINGDRHAMREWKSDYREAMRDWRAQVREQRRDMMSDWRDGQAPWMPARSDDELIARFKGQMISSFATIGFLGLVNAVTSPQFPWAIFPAGGIMLGVVGRYAKLRGRGITWGQIFGGEPAKSAPQSPEGLAKLVKGFRRHLTWLAGSAAGAMASFAIGSTFHIDPMVIPFGLGVIGTMIGAQRSLVDWLQLRRAGISAGDALGDGWKPIAARADTRTVEQKAKERLALLAGDSVLASRYGEMVRNAVEDRVTITDVLTKLGDADKALIPDVEPTAEALLERVGALAQGLERLDRDLPGDALPQLEARVQAAEAEPESAPDRERRLSLLTRQRDSLRELAERRDTMARQLESASLALRSLRFDIVKLRTMGVDAAVNDVTSATQEARALSRDLGYVLDAAKETRSL
ncbi:MAG: protein kinase [Gemmatimonadaceae bacterium]|nr:protein kinase [Gemmatimonadaceae bacterium]